MPHFQAFSARDFNLFFFFFFKSGGSSAAVLGGRKCLIFPFVGCISVAGFGLAP